jgi:hypothetical protein
LLVLLFSHLSISAHRAAPQDIMQSLDGAIRFSRGLARVLHKEEALEMNEIRLWRCGDVVEAKGEMLRGMVPKDPAKPERPSPHLLEYGAAPCTGGALAGRTVCGSRRA